MKAVEICAVAFVATLAVAYGWCPEEEGDYPVIFPNNRDCNSFFICAHGNPVAFTCPAGLEFNADLSVCDWPAHAGCIVTTPRPRPTTTTRRPRTTTRRPTTTTTTTRRPWGRPPWRTEIESDVDIE